MPDRLLLRANTRIPAEALLSEDVVRRHALRVLAWSPFRGWAHPEDLDALAKRFDGLSEPLQTGFLTNARRDLELILDAAQSDPTHQERTA